MNEIRFIDLFSGIGGFRLGLERSGGYRCVWSCDNSKPANEVYYKKFKPGRGEHFSGDVRRVNPKTIPDFDMLCAGFPCQSFSVSGRGRGFQDTRGTLFFEICRIAEAKKPTLLLLENVKGLLHNKRGETFKIILQSLEDLGYWVEWQVFNSRHFVPQNRQRVFIIGHLGDKCGQEVFPIFEYGEIPEEERNETLPSLTATDWKGPSKQRATIVLADRSRHLNKRGRNLESPKFVANSLTSVDKDNYIIKNRGLRVFTPLERERLQGFPDNWTHGLSNKNKNVLTGNAVTVNVIEFLGERILSLFTNNEGSK